MSNPSRPPVRIGLCGAGTVGAAVIDLLAREAPEIERRLGRRLALTVVGLRRARPDLDLGDARIVDDLLDVARADDVDVVVELIGGADLAHDVVACALDAGKAVVTANKALIAEHGEVLLASAERSGAALAFEAAVAGGIPVLKALREGLAANRIEWIAGIINGTSNFILSDMRQSGRDFADVLAEAQALGYAEADPTFDVDGTDAAHKLAILASLAFGAPLRFDAGHNEGIDLVTREDIGYAEDLGFRIKPLAICRATQAGIELRVHPTLVPADQLIAGVDGVMNAVLIASQPVGTTLYHGPGAGGGATASSVVADIIDVARTLDVGASGRVPAFAFPSDGRRDVPVLPMADVTSAYYLRVLVRDEPGVLARIATLLADQGISIEALLQRDSERREVNGEPRVPIVIVTQRVREAACDAAIAQIEALDAVDGPLTRLRVEDLSAP